MVGRMGFICCSCPTPRVASMADEEEKHQMCLVETLPRLKSVQVSLLTEEGSVSLSQKTVPTSRESSAATVCDPSIANSITPLSFPHTCINVDLSQLDLSSFSDPRLVKGVLSLRFKTRSPAVVIPPPSDFLVKYDESPPSELVLSCTFCGLELTRNGAFQRVLPLPSDSWDEFGGSVFCHHHGHSECSEKKDVLDVASSMQLAPRDHDCLTSTSILLLTEHSLDMQTIHKDHVTKCIYCKRCMLFLGAPMSSKGVSSATLPSYSLQRANICAYASRQPDVPTSLSGLEAYLAQRLYSFSQSKMQFKYSVKNSSGWHYLDIWMLNVICKTDMLTSGPRAYSKFSGEKLEEKRSSKALKLLYKFVLESKKCVPCEEDLELSEEHCLKLCLILADSNNTLPPGQRKASGYCVGFLLY